MKLQDSFISIEKLRKRLGAELNSYEFGGSLDPMQKIVVQLETEGIVVERNEIESVGSFLTYKGEVLAILYIYNSNNSKNDLEADFPQ
mgnify:FL=1